ncbi:MAG: type II toxin-antitoxin system RelE/ParE family toxin [Lacipirellulaceae bacterium]
MTLRPIFTGPAIRDLADIWKHVAIDRVDAADRLVEEVDRRVRLLCLHPAIGERDRRVGGCRRVIVGRYLLFYEHCDSPRLSDSGGGGIMVPQGGPSDGRTRG